MESNDLTNNEKWVEARLNRLAPPDTWTPDPTAALGKVRARERAFRKRRARWAWSGMAASLVCLGLLLTPARCAFGVCRTQAPDPAAEQEPVPAPTATPDFKESGSAGAPVTAEIFSDYQCPHCATVFDQVVPMLRAEYVQTGKMKLVHRDYPLAMHAYARLAARYANAAGMLGVYEIAVDRIFRTQAAWAQSGDVDGQLSQVLDPGIMRKLRDLVRNDGHLDDTVSADVALAQQDRLNQTPTLVVTYRGKRQVIAPIPPYSLLKSYLDDLLTK